MLYYSDWLVAPESKHIPSTHRIQSLPSEERERVVGFDLRNEDWVLRTTQGKIPPGAIGKNSSGHWAYRSNMSKKTKSDPRVRRDSATQIDTSSRSSEAQGQVSRVRTQLPDLIISQISMPSRASDDQGQASKVRTPLPSSRPAQHGRGAGLSGQGTGTLSKRRPADNENTTNGESSKRGRRS